MFTCLLRAETHLGPDSNKMLKMSKYLPLYKDIKCWYNEFRWPWCGTFELSALHAKYAVGLHSTGTKNGFLKSRITCTIIYDCHLPRPSWATMKLRLHVIRLKKLFAFVCVFCVITYTVFQWYSLPDGNDTTFLGLLRLDTGKKLQDGWEPNISRKVSTI